MQTGMEPLFIDWAKEKPKMGQIIRHFMFIADNSVFKSIVQYFFSARSMALNEFYLMMNFEKKIILLFLKYP